MFEIISNKKEIDTLQLKFFNQLKKHMTRKMKVYVGYKPNRLLLELYYSEALGIWWTFQKLSDKYWNSFGIGEPSDKHNNSITCEINYPLDGINTRLAGGLAKNEDGEVILIHNGRIGGGKKGIGKNMFIDNYIGKTVEINIKNRVLEYVPVGSLNSERFAAQVAHYIKEVARIKCLPKIDSPDIPDILTKKLKTSFNHEFWGEKTIERRPSGVAICDHGLVVEYLKDFFQEKGLHVANDRERDLYIIKEGKTIETVFEFKTGTDRQSVYSAIGQLFLNNADLNPIPKYFIVLPSGLGGNIQTILKSLDIQILEYVWKGKGKLQFLNLENLSF